MGSWHSQWSVKAWLHLAFMESEAVTLSISFDIHWIIRFIGCQSHSSR